MSSTDALGLNWAKGLHPEDRDRVLSEWHAAFTNSGVFESEYRFLLQNQKTIWVIGRAAAIRDADQQVTGYIGSISDITSRKLAELKVKEAKQRMRFVLDASPHAILSIDASGRIMGWNQGAVRTFGWTEEEAVGLVCPTVPEAWLEDFHDMVRCVLAGEEFKGQVKPRQKKNGDLIHASISARPLFDAHGQKTGIVVILEDVTERERANERVRALVQERESLMQDLHDGCIQSVYAIGLNLEACRKLVSENPAKAADVIADATANLNLVIQELRSFIGGSKREFNTGDAFIAEIERTIQAAGDHAPQFTLDIDVATVNSLSADQASHLLQIAREGISNIVRHANASTAGVSLQTHGNTICLEVRDDGIGFIAALHQGTGLGLHHISARALKLSGHFQISSEPNRGTHLKIEIAGSR
jgi:PAS domain S-box-containing protein